MYICRDCGHVFEDDEKVVIRDDPSPDGVSLPSGYYEYYECPHCGSDDITAAGECIVCGEWFEHHTYEGICDDCFAAIESQIEKIREDAGLTYTQFKDFVINELY